MTHGLVLIDKEAGMTSHDVVAKMRKIAGTKKVGHAGTLDPMATGLLVLGIGKATRLLTYLVGLDKVYEATIRLGQSTTTDDAEGEIITSAGADALAEEAIRSSIAEFIGTIDQRPSSVSAIKIDGKRAYARVREGEEVELPTRQVQVYSYTVQSHEEALSVSGTPVVDVKVVVHCSSGTYIRALARDLGQVLGTGGHLVALRRTHVGPFSVGHSAVLADAAANLQLLSLPEAMQEVLPVRKLSEAEAKSLSFGQPITSSRSSEPIAAISSDGQAIAILRDDAGQAKPEVVFAANQPSH